MNPQPEASQPKPAGLMILAPDPCNEETTSAMGGACGLCAKVWGSDENWLSLDTRGDGRYGIYQYSTGVGDLIEVFNRDLSGLGIVEFDVNRLDDPDLKLFDILGVDANTNLSCVREGGF
jgi:hypothetical protein